MSAEIRVDFPYIGVEPTSFIALRKIWKQKTTLLCSDTICHWVGACSDHSKDFGITEVRFGDEYVFSISSGSYLIDTKDAEGQQIC